MARQLSQRPRIVSPPLATAIHRPIESNRINTAEKAFENSPADKKADKAGAKKLLKGKKK